MGEGVGGRLRRALNVRFFNPSPEFQLWQDILNNRQTENAEYALLFSLIYSSKLHIVACANLVRVWRKKVNMTTQNIILKGQSMGSVSFHHEMYSLLTRSKVKLI